MQRKTLKVRADERNNGEKQYSEKKDPEREQTGKRVKRELKE